MMSYSWEFDEFLGCVKLKAHSYQTEDELLFLHNWILTLYPFLPIKGVLIGKKSGNQLCIPGVWVSGFVE